MSSIYDDYVPFPWGVLRVHADGQPTPDPAPIFEAYDRWILATKMDKLEDRMEELRAILVQFKWCITPDQPGHEGRFWHVLFLGNQYILDLFRSAPFRLWPKDWHQRVNPKTLHDCHNLIHLYNMPECHQLCETCDPGALESRRKLFRGVFCYDNIPHYPKSVIRQYVGCKSVHP